MAISLVSISTMRAIDSSPATFFRFFILPLFTVFWCGQIAFSAQPAQKAFAACSNDTDECAPCLPPPGFSAIYSVEDLDAIRTNLVGSYFLCNDIDLAGREFLPIGSASVPFRGSLNGNGRTIRNLTVTLSGSHAALFASTDSAQLHNLTLTNASVRGQTRVAALSGYDFNSLFSDVVVTGDIEGVGAYVGGIVAEGRSTTLEESSFAGNVVGADHSGGIAGHLAGDSSVVRCSGTGSVSGNWEVGGLIGSGYGLSQFLSISESKAVSRVTGVNDVGGLVGKLSDAQLLYSYSQGGVSGSTYVGGLSGTLGYTAVHHSYSSASVLGSAAVGSLTGRGTASGANRSYARGDGANEDLPVCGLCINFGGQNLTKAELRLLANFADWSISYVDDNATTVWKVPRQEGRDYPSLAWERLRYSSCELPVGFTPLSSAEDVAEMRYNLQGEYALCNNIDMTSLRTEFAPIGGSYSSAFSGVFDGRGFTVSRLSINAPTRSNTALFGFTRNAEIRNLSLSKAVIIGLDYVGAIVGESRESQFSGLAVTGGSVVGRNFVGGLAASLVGSILTDSRSEALIVGKSFLGTAVGSSAVNSVIEAVAAEGVVQSTYSFGVGVGGVVGTSLATTLRRLSFQGDIIGISTTSAMGGAVGRLELSSQIENSSARGSVQLPNGSSGRMGGLVGLTADNSSVMNSYAAVELLGGSAFSIGGLIGYSFSPNPVAINSYWDTEVAGVSYSVAGEGRATAQMTSTPPPSDTYVAWDFSTPANPQGVWSQSSQVNGGYPYLTSSF